MQVDRIGVERTLRLAAVVTVVLGVRRLVLLLLRRFRDAVRNVVDNVETRNPALIQEIDGVRFLLAEHGDEHVRTGHFLLARRLDVQDGALDHALETLRRLRVRIGMSSEPGRVLIDEIGENAAQLVEIDAARFQHFGRRRVVQHREQQVLDGDELVLLLSRFDKSHVEGDFQFLGNHGASSDFGAPPETIPGTAGGIASLAAECINAQVSSIVHCNGCWCLRARSMTWSTFVVATSRVYVPQTPMPSR